MCVSKPLSSLPAVGSVTGVPPEGLSCIPDTGISQHLPGEWGWCSDSETPLSWRHSGDWIQPTGCHQTSLPARKEEDQGSR